MTALFHDSDRNLLIYQGDPPAIRQIALALPACARTINGSCVVLPNNWQVAQVLRRMNFPVAPVMQDYDWPSLHGRKPWEAQKLTANFLVTHPRSFVLSDMGTGKTLSALWAADYLMRQHPPGVFRALIVAPLSTLELTWANAIFANFLSSRSFAILHGSAADRQATLAKPADFYIINFDGVGVGAHTRGRMELDGFSKALSEFSEIKLVIVDEASAYKDAQTKRHKLARQIIGKRPYLWLMTGTPTPNAPTDAYGLAKLVNNAYGKSFTQFRMESMYKLTQWKWVPMKDGYDKARRLLSPAIRIPIEDVWDAPEMTYQQRQVELTDEQKLHMKRLKASLQVELKSGALVNVVNEAAARTKYMQISLGAIYDAAHDSHLVDAKPRMRELIDICEQAPGKILIFASLTNVVKMIYARLKEHWATEIVYGDTSQKERTRIFTAFQTDVEPRIIVADPGTMGHGLDLFAARTVIWYGPTEKPELYEQANKRAHRPGQKFPVSIVEIVSNPLEKEIYHRLKTKTALQGALLNLVRKGEL